MNHYSLIILLFLSKSVFCQTETIETRFKVPEGFTRTKVKQSSFAYYLRNLPLKPANEKVRYFDGRSKEKYGVYLAVVKMDIGKKDLQQCADAVMRLRGEFLFHSNQKEKIHFNFLSDGKAHSFNQFAKGDLSYPNFRKYMELVFERANTASLFHELKTVAIDKMEIGDVFIQKGNPYGHAVIVVDMAQNDKGKKIYVLAQSYMPAQETQILVNPSDGNLSPWYDLEYETIITPEWIFYPTDLKGFSNE